MVEDEEPDFAGRQATSPLYPYTFIPYTLMPYTPLSAAKKQKINVNSTFIRSGVFCMC
jgi:hypothetical protein